MRYYDIEPTSKSQVRWLLRRGWRRRVGRRGLVGRRPVLLRGAARVRVLRVSRRRRRDDAVVRLGLLVMRQRRRSLVCQPEIGGGVEIRLDSHLHSCLAWACCRNGGCGVFVRGRLQIAAARCFISASDFTHEIDAIMRLEAELHDSLRRRVQHPPKVKGFVADQA